MSSFFKKIKLFLKKVYKYTCEMFIKLVTIIIITNIYIIYKNIDVKGILPMLPDKLDYIMVITFFVFAIIIPNLISNKFNNKKWIKILKITATTSFGTVHVATGFIFGLAINTLFHDLSAGIDIIKSVFGLLFALWFIVIIVSYILEDILKRSFKNT